MAATKANTANPAYDKQLAIQHRVYAEIERREREDPTLCLDTSDFPEFERSVEALDDLMGDAGEASYSGHFDGFFSVNYRIRKGWYFTPHARRPKAGQDIGYWATAGEAFDEAVKLCGDPD